jgi:integrase
MGRTKVTRINIRFVQAFVDRHGKVRHYYRRHGYPRTALPGLPGSAEFMEAYANVQPCDVPAPARVATDKLTPGTINAAIIGIYQSPAFLALKAITKTGLRSRLETFRAQYGDKRVATLQRRNINDMLAEKAGKPGAQLNTLRTLKALMTFAVDAGMRPDNPTIGIKVSKKKSDGHHSWSEDEIAMFEAPHPIGTRSRLALALLLYTAQRRADVVRMGRQHVRDGLLHVTQSKTGVSLAIPIHETLADIVAATPSEHMTFLATHTGLSFTPAGFGNWFRGECRLAGLPLECAAHGLRKAACRRLAEAGCSAHEIMSISGHKTLSEIERYTKAADQVRMARKAMASISTNREQTGVKPSVKPGRKV